MVLLAHYHDDSQRMYAEFLRAHGYTVVDVPTAYEALPVARDADLIVTGFSSRERSRGQA